MIKWWKSVVFCIAALTCTVVGERSSSALEPNDNSYPWEVNLAWYGNATNYVCNNLECWWYSMESISPSGDVDYLTLICGKGLITQARINFTGASGDLDMQVYKLDGTFLGGSYGTGNDEIVNTSSAARNALMMKVYGYNGATNTYTIIFDCSSS